MWRHIIAVLVGLVCGMALNTAIIQLNSTVFFPMPPVLDPNDPSQFNAYLETLPQLAFVPVLFAHLGQAFVGGWVAARLAPSHPMRHALLIGVISLIGGIIAMTMFDGPAWLAIELPLYIAFAWAAGRLETRRREAC
ncbi:MAG: hypothetical protein ACPGU1_10025 [Myxococcota bacterium]